VHLPFPAPFQHGSAHDLLAQTRPCCHIERQVHSVQHPAMFASQPVQLLQGCFAWPITDDAEANELTMPVTAFLHSAEPCNLAIHLNAQARQPDLDCVKIRRNVD